MSQPNDRRFGGKLDRLHSPQRRAMLEVERVVQHTLAGLDAPQRLLDIGTGGGLFAQAFAERGLGVAGIDVNPELLEAAREYVPQGEFHEAPAEQLPFADKTFDIAFMSHVLHEVDDYVGALQEARRVARQRVVVVEWPYREGDEQGPPLDHRLPHEAVLDYAQQAGFSRVESHMLTYMQLYVMEV